MTGMARFYVALFAIGLVLAASNAQVVANQLQFPKITTQNLNERVATFPAELPGDLTLVLIAFYREQQAELNVWIEELGLNGADAPAWIEMPVMPDYGSLWCAFANNGTRSGITTSEARARVFTVYASRDKFRADLNLPTAEQVYVLAVRRDGRVIARADGSYTQAKSAPLRKAVSLP